MTSEFRRQQSRVWWSSFHGDDLRGSLRASLSSPIPAAASTPTAAVNSPRIANLMMVAASPVAAPATPDGVPAVSPSGSPLEQQSSSRDSSSSPSTSHKSQDSGFSDSDGPHPAHASPLSSSPETAGAASQLSQLASTPSPTHTRLQLCLSGACTTPHLGATSFGGHATPVELRKRLSKDDSCIQARPLPPVPGPSGPSGPSGPGVAGLLRRQWSAEERPTTTRVLLSRSIGAGQDEDGDLPSTPLNQTFPLAGHIESGHRALRRFMVSRRTSASSPSSSTASSRRHRDSACSEASSDVSVSESHATVLERPGVAPGADLLDDGHQPYLEMTPAHTSTPKATPILSAATAVTPTRRPTTAGVARVAVRGAAAGCRRLHDKRNARPVNLLHNFEWVPAPDAVPEPVSEAVSAAGGAVAAWLGQLRLSCEPECSSTLQSKALLGADPRGLRQLSGLQGLHPTSPHGLGQLQRRAHQLSTEYTKLCGLVQRGALEQVSPLTQVLVQHVLDFLADYEEAAAVPEDRAGRLRAACDRLRADAVRERPGAPPGPDPADMAASLAAVRAALTATVDAILEKHVQELVNVLEGPASPLALRAAVSALCALGRQGSALADLVVRCGGVRALLQVVLDGRTSPTRRAALRALAAVCCTARAVRSLEQAGGVEVVAELLAETDRPEEELAEAAAVLAQITAPWVPDNAKVDGLARHLDPVVHALTRLVRCASSGEALLLAAAALAHLSYVEASAVWPLLASGASGAVLQAVRTQGPRCSVFLQEQAATLVANLSAVPEARAELAEDRAVVALLCFLQLRPSPLQRSADIAAAERVQHKAAIALSRLASDPEVARQVVSLEGVPRLVRLCRDERERNHSDGVLVACLAALRKIAANCGSIVLSKRDRLELLEPRLLDSFMLFSTRQESYV